MIPTIHDLLFEFMEKIDEIYGVYLDSSSGFIQNLRLLEKAQLHTQTEANLSTKYLDTLPYMYAKGDPNDPATVLLHESTQGEYKQRNKEDGLNHIIIAHLCLTQIYQYWEDHYRGLMASSLGITKEELKSDIFGDLRLYRHSIIHHRAIALPDITKCKLLKWHNVNDQIILDKNQIEELILQVKIGLNSIPETYCS